MIRGHPSILKHCVDLRAAGCDDAEIRKHLFTACDFASSLETDLIYLVACRCFPYFGGVVSVWVYFAVIDRSGQDESAMRLAEESRAVASAPL